MKKLIIIASVIFSSVAASAQAINQQPAGTGDSLTNVRLAELEEKLNRQEAQLKTIQKENQQLKKDTPASKKSAARPKRISVSRQGSKQLVVE